MRALRARVDSPKCRGSSASVPQVQKPVLGQAKERALGDCLAHRADQARALLAAKGAPVSGCAIRFIKAMEATTEKKVRSMGKKTSKASSAPTSFDSLEMFEHFSKITLTAQFLDAGIHCVPIFVPNPNPRLRNAGVYPGCLQFIIPCLILHVFSLEIILKCLLNLRGISFERSHFLKVDLFDKLPTRDKKRACTLFTELAKQVPSIARLKRDFGVTLTLPLFRKSCEHVFQRTRYVFEYGRNSLPKGIRGRKGTAGTTGLPVAIEVLRKLILDTPETADWEKISRAKIENPIPARK